MMIQDQIDKKAIALSFGSAASTYDAAAHFQRWVGETLLEEFLSSQEFLSHRAQSNVLDLGTGTGHFLPYLKRAFSPSLLVGADLSEGMLRYVQGQQTNAPELCAADADSLPFRDNSFDLVFSSLAIQWCADLSILFEQVLRCLKPGGSFVFSTLFDGSLLELKQAWGEVDNAQHVNSFFSRDDYLDALATLPYEIDFAQQREKILYYDKALTLSKELKALGAHNMTPKRQKGLTGKQRLKRFIEAYEAHRLDDQRLPATYQVGFFSITKPVL